MCLPAGWRRDNKQREGDQAAHLQPQHGPDAVGPHHQSAKEETDGGGQQKGRRERHYHGRSRVSTHCWPQPSTIAHITFE